MILLLIALMLSLLTACAAPAATIPPGAQPSTAASSTSTPMPPAATITNADQAIATAKEKFPQLNDIKQTPPGTIGASSNIIVLDQPDGWNIVFWQGSGDCPAGCINNRYWYVAVRKSGEVTMVGEFVQEFSSRTNTMETRGQPMWGIPK